MAAKRRATHTNERGPRGQRGRTGATGPAGPAGPASNGDVKKLAAQMAEVVKELQTQLTRIAQLQMQLDRMSRGEFAEPAPHTRRAGDVKNH